MAKIFICNNYYTEGTKADVAQLAKALETEAHLYTRRIDTDEAGNKIYYLS